MENEKMQSKERNQDIELELYNGNLRIMALKPFNI